MMDPTHDVDLSTIISERINKSFEKMFHKNVDGTYAPFVCIVCDRILKHTEVQTVSIRLLKNSQHLLCEQTEMDLIPEIKNCYTITSINDCSDNKVLQTMLLSPRSPFITKNRLDGYTCCASCLHGLRNSKMPKYAIANGYFVGTPPKVLTDLTMVERALLTPVKTWGYCFTYSGGHKTGLRGNMTYYKTSQMQMKGNLHFKGVSQESITKALAQFDALGLNNDVVVILHGWMTPEQRRRAEQRNTIRVDKVLDAIKWLIRYNQEWKNRSIDFEKIKNDLVHPFIIDRSQEIQPSTEKENQNIEESETFHVFFPDGSVTQVSGGQQSMEDFSRIIKEKKLAGFRASVQCDLHSKYVYDYKDNNLVNACILQFPFGRGGLNEPRQRGNGTMTDSTDVGDYIYHLSHLSQKHFHEELFCLILYNMCVKNMMLKTASWKVRGGISAEMISQDLTQEDVEMALGERTQARFHPRRQHTPGRAYVNAIDATARNVPHTNEAAYQARKVAEAIQFEHGQASWFLTVTPDDDNSFLIQVYSDTDIDISTIDITSVTEEEARLRAQKRTSLRIEFPGIAAFFFENALDIVIKDVIGWDIISGEKTPEIGLFGPPVAFSAAIEEQGKGTLHVHMLIWNERFNLMREQMHSLKRTSAIEAKKNIITSIDNIATSRLIGPEKNIGQNMVPHACKQSYHSYHDLPSICTDQDLRYMRHQKAYKTSLKTFATCQACGQTWTDMDILKSYMSHVKDIPNINENTDLLNMMKSYMISYQKGDRPVDEDVVHAAYDKHIHTKSCFRCEKVPKNKRSLQCGLRDYECRYRFPRRKKQRTDLKPIHENPIKWYLWDGSYVDRHILEINMQRSAYDVFQNVSCVAITRSKLACNTNITGLLAGPATYYAFKYNMKGTQDDDEACYDRILEATKKSLLQTMPEKTLYSIAVSRLLRAAFAHQKTNVIRGTLASFLTRNKSRFVFSHESAWCPISDLKHVMKGEKAFSTIQHAGPVPFFECSALNYICRPFELEELSPYDFYAKYESVKLTKNLKDSGSFLSFENIFDRRHPSYNEKSNKFFKCIIQREKRCLVKFSPYLFPDSAQFGGTLLDPMLDTNEDIETYCENVLILFYAYRRIDDIQICGSYHKKLINIIQTTGIPTKITRILQNIIDCRANATRYKSTTDDLQRCTFPYSPTSGKETDYDEDGGYNQEDENDMLQLEEMMLHLEHTDESNIQDYVDQQDIPSELSLRSIRSYGKHRCGFDHIAGMKGTNTLNVPFIIQHNGHDTNQMVEDAIPDIQKATTSISKFNERDFVKILLTRTSRSQRTVQSNLNSDTGHQRLDANGSVASILDWAICGNLDNRQKRSFEIFSATFVMTFYHDAVHDHDFNDVDFQKEKNLLLKLIEKQPCEDEQLICFLHGPAGCGKSTVIDLFLEYAKEFSNALPGFSFNSKTIRVTAMSGAAATLIGGETTHSALHINQKQRMKPDQIEEWIDTRMLIIDEISFASSKQLRKINERLGVLKQNRNLPYGGLHVIFSGDMRQLEPCKPSGQPIYDEYCPEFDGFINMYITLQGQHRFKDDPEWGELLGRFRDGNVRSEDIETINSRVVHPNQTIPDKTRYATFYNRCRDAINAAIFEKHCFMVRDQNKIAQDSIVVFSDNIQIKNHEKVYVNLRNRRHFWDSCGEQHIQDTGFNGRMDPVLRLYTGCPIMYPYNKDVPNGIANGTQGLVHKVFLMHGTPVRYTTLKDGTRIRAVYSSEIKNIEIQHVNKRIRPRIFSVTPQQYTCKVRMLKPKALQTKTNDRELVYIKCKQIPLIINNATTGHKLQGVGVDILFVHEWLYGANWPYVVLSRVTTLQGLFIRKRIRSDLSTYAMPEKLQNMLDRLGKKEPSYWSNEQYHAEFAGL